TTASGPYFFVNPRSSTDAKFHPPDQAAVVRGQAFLFGHIFSGEPLHTSPENAPTFNQHRDLRDLPSGAGENRLALFHEGLAALFIIAAPEAGVHGILRALEIALTLVLHHFADHRLHGANGQRRISSNSL